MRRRKVLKRLLLGSGAVIALGSSVAGWKFSQLTRTPDWYILQTNQDLLAELVDVILPPTDTVGAKDAGVPAFIEHMVQTGLDVKSQNNFISGLQDVKAYCQSTYGKRFGALTLDEKNSTLLHFEARAHSFNDITTKVQKALLGKPFFATLRDLTIIGFCSSEPGMTQALAYDYIPGTFNGCVPYVDGQKSWATQ